MAGHAAFTKNPPGFENMLSSIFALMCFNHALIKLFIIVHKKYIHTNPYGAPLIKTQNLEDKR